MNIVVTDHAAERFAQRVWPSMHQSEIKSRDKIEAHIRSIYANGKSLGKPYPIDLQPWAHLIKLGNDKFFRWEDGLRVGMVCRVDGDNRVVLTCFSASFPGLSAAETVEMLKHPKFYDILMAVSEVSPMMAMEDRVALAKRLAKKLEKI